MKTIRSINQKMMLGLFSLALLFPTTTLAATQWPPEGGQWNYGYGVGAYSDYMNSSVLHGSTVVANGTSNHASAPAGSWSQALMPFVYSGASFYYNLGS